MSFGKQMRLRREELHLSRAALAEELGVSPSAISNYENGVSSPKEEVLLRLFDALEIDPNYLYRDSFRSGSFVCSRAEQDLIEKCRSLSPLERETVGSLVSALCTMHTGREEAERAAPHPALPLDRGSGLRRPRAGEDFDYIVDHGDVPPGAEFAVRIRDDSLEPVLHGGSVAYLNHDPLHAGDVGIFCVGGDMLCKQYYRDPLGVSYLFSLGRDRGADVVCGPESGKRFICFGHVILDHRVPLPRYGPVSGKKAHFAWKKT